MPGGPPQTVDIELDGSPETLVSGGQPHIRDIEPGGSPETLVSGGQPLIPTSGSDQPFLSHGGLPLRQAPAVGFRHKPDSHLAGLPSSLGLGLTATLPDGHPPSPGASDFGESEDGVPFPEGSGSSFVQLFGLVREFLNVPSPVTPSSSHLTGVERTQDTAVSVPPPLTLPRSLLAQSVREEAQCRALGLPKPCSAPLCLPKDWHIRARSFTCQKAPLWILLL